MRVKPLGPDGLLFWVSEDEVTPTPYSDYMAIGLRDGYVQFGYNLGSGEILIIGNHTRINDTRWHTIRIHRCIRIV
jgi:pikachurin